MILPWEEHRPTLAESVFVAPDASIIGRASIAEESSIWFGTVIRADVERVEIGQRTNLQDRTVVHVVTDRHPTRVGDDVTVGHAAVLHGCTISNRVLVGIGAVILDGASVGEDCIVAAGSLVPPGMDIPSGKLVMGTPARLVRDLRKDDLDHLRESATRYVALARRYRAADLSR